MPKGEWREVFYPVESTAPEHLIGFARTMDGGSVYVQPVAADEAVVVDNESSAMMALGMASGGRMQKKRVFEQMREALKVVVASSPSTPARLIGQKALAAAEGRGE